MLKSICKAYQKRMFRYCLYSEELMWSRTNYDLPQFSASTDKLSALQGSHKIFINLYSDLLNYYSHKH